jgi:hypothetical protein
MTDTNKTTQDTETTDSQAEIVMGTWKELVDEQIQRLDGAFDEAARRHEQMLSQVEGAVEELGRLMKDSLALHGQMSREWLKIARGTTARAGELVETLAAR